MRSIFFLIALFLCIPLQKGYAQNSDFFYPYAGFAYLKHLEGDIGICYGNDQIGVGPCGPVSRIVFIPKLGSEFTVDNRKLVITPKASLELDILVILGMRVSLVDYTNFDKNDYRFLPEIGISAGGALDIFYGYNIPLTNERLSWVSYNRITITWNLPLWPPKNKDTN